MIFENNEKRTELISLDSMISHIGNTMCKCRNRRDDALSDIDSDETMGMCKICCAKEHIADLPIKDKAELVKSYGYEIVTTDKKRAYNYFSFATNKSGERYYGKCCDECGSLEIEGLVDNKYYMCPKCRAKYIKLNTFDEGPYLIEVNTNIVHKYNPNYGDDKICECGHSYDRHFDSYEDMASCWCKYCRCSYFKEKK